MQQQDAPSMAGQGDFMSAEEVAFQQKKGKKVNPFPLCFLPQPALISCSLGSWVSRALAFLLATTCLQRNWDPAEEGQAGPPALNSAYIIFLWTLAVLGLGYLSSRCLPPAVAIGFPAVLCMLWLSRPLDC